MTTVRQFGMRDFFVCILIVAAAAGARSWYLHTCADDGLSPGPIQVQDPKPTLASLPPDMVPQPDLGPTDLGALVHNLKQHRWFGSQAPLSETEELTAHTAPGYPWLLYWLELSPVDVSPVGRTVRWVQCGLGAVTAGLYFLFALRAFGSLAVASLAGLLCAFHPFWVVNTADIDDGVVTSFLLALCLYFGTRGGQSGAPFSSYLYGLCLAGLALMRAALLPFAVVALLWFLIRSRAVRRGWLSALLALLGLLSGLAPWTFHNYQAFHELIPVADSTFLHLWKGNNPQSDGGPQSERATLENLAESRGQEPRETAQALDQTSQPQRYASLGRDILKQVQSDPAGFWRHRLESGLAFFFGAQWLKDRTLWQVNQDPGVKMPPWLASSYAALFYGSLFGMLILGVLGWRWTYGWRREAMPSSLALMWIPLPYILAHAEALSGPRLPVDGVLWCYAAFAVVGLLTPSGRILLRGPAS